MSSRSHVYIFSCNKFVKIGIAKDIYNRITDIQVGNPYQFNYEWSSGPLSRKTARKMEKHLHCHFAGFRERGEWFKLTPGRVIQMAERAYPKFVN